MKPQVGKIIITSLLIEYIAKLHNTIINDTFEIANEFNNYFNTIWQYIYIARQIKNNEFMKLDHTNLQVGLY